METQNRSSAFEEELRGKRRASSDEWTANKKRALSSASGSPIVANGPLDDEQKPSTNNGSRENDPETEDDLERFRKGAIFRRMRHYRRETIRAFERIQHLEESLRLSNLERISAESCWSNTMAALRTLTQADMAMENPAHNLSSNFPSRVFAPEDFKRSKRSWDERFKAAEQAVDVIANFAGKVDGPKAEELVAECHSLQRSNSFLTAEAEQTHALLEDSRRERDHYLEELRATEAKLDRLQSRIVNPQPEHESESPVPVKVNGDVKAEEERDSVGVKEGTPSVALPPVISISESRPDEEWEARLKLRDDRLAYLERENAALRDRLVLADSEINLLGESTITKTPTYRVLLEYASKLDSQSKEQIKQLAMAREEANQLRQIQTGWLSEIQSDDANGSSDLKIILKKRDDDLNRIRLHRDQLETQYKELKATQDTKRLSLSKFKELAESRAERIELLLSEVKRLKARLAASSGNEDLLNFLLNDANINADYVESLRKRLTASEEELASLRATLNYKNKDLVDIAILRGKLNSVTQQLEAYKSRAESSLVEQLQAKEEELRLMKLKETQSTQEMNELFSEMDRLSKAWENADKMAQSQAMSLEKWEEEKEKLLLAKQKSDNKYYKAMNESEAKDGERKQALRNVERQTKQIEALERNEKELLAINESLSSELAKAKQLISTLQNAVDLAERSLSSYKGYWEEEGMRVSQLQEQSLKREQEVAELNMQTVKLKDELLKATKEAERAVQKAKSVNKPLAPASEREADLQREVDKCLKLLKCSLCQNHMRNTVITKCMHTFCKVCVDARISSRQRKCPACNLAFALSEVQALYLQ
ncbi:uncharacterized protein FOMMEDRAFT_134051 [Fomitiporia mediterranea MF3/22]|uniref:uncharacterized protein n=1 Tax=Fomitiporia mediterranea (strain MF3/22) TaxID=694068 RepID=UPI00044088B5|nr:uncharacterized protein FOMMEDRAFT_134051 [Fomitiporia mediterranea MF3/22]EJD02861.1 hypothetical protein FOMMEDRAFT_134051 [Fomitiporia mediterranea MF3/22]